VALASQRVGADADHEPVCGQLNGRVDAVAERPDRADRQQDGWVVPGVADQRAGQDASREAIAGRAVRPGVEVGAELPAQRES
jgi:hypothetical protein